MQRAVSAARLNHSNQRRNLSKSPSLRAVYINQETNKRSVNTHFHSPFKQGKRNRDYVNPSFVSNHLFYPKEIIERKAEVVVRSSYIPNAGELARQNQYRERIRTEANAYNQLLEKTQQYERRVKQQMSHVQVRGSRLVEPEQLLKKELNSLVNYREKIGTVNERERTNQDQIPPYFEKKRRDNAFESDFLDYKQKAIQQYLKQYNQQKSQQKQRKRDQREKENLHIQRNMAQNNKQNATKEKILKEKSSLLGTILKEQMLIRNKSKVFA